MAGGFEFYVTAFVVVNVQIEQQCIMWLLPASIIIPLGNYQLSNFLGKKAKVTNELHS